jgi:phytol kinase
MKNSPRDISLVSFFSHELIRKFLHMSMVMIVPISYYQLYLAILAIAAASCLYIISEILRLHLGFIGIIGSVTRMATRHTKPQDIDFGPLTLSFGILLVLILFPRHIASTGIVALTIGDGLASLVGRTWGKHRPAFLFGKSIEGTLSCWVGCTIAFIILQISWPIAIALGLITAIIELLPLKSLDNLLIPLIVCLTMMWLS